MIRASNVDPELPLIDLHRHIDGNVRLATILELGKRHGIKLPGATIEQLRPHVQIDWDLEPHLRPGDCA